MCVCGSSKKNAPWRVRCSAGNCPIGWFHNECTELQVKPKYEAWYCYLCRRGSSVQRKRIPDLLSAYEQYKLDHPDQDVISKECDLQNVDDIVAV